VSCQVVEHDIGSVDFFVDPVCVFNNLLLRYVRCLCCAGRHGEGWRGALCLPVYLCMSISRSVNMSSSMLCRAVLCRAVLCNGCPVSLWCRYKHEPREAVSLDQVACLAPSAITQTQHPANVVALVSARNITSAYYTSSAVR